MLKTNKSEAKIEAKKTTGATEQHKAQAHSPKVIVHSTPVRTEIICERAFRLFEQRGCIHGYDVQDWLEAEKQINEESLN